MPLPRPSVSPARRSLSALSLALLAATPAAAQGIAAAVLPSARGGQVGEPLTVFGLALNATGAGLTGCRPEVDTAFSGVVPASFSYQTTDTLNALTGSADTPFSLAAGGAQGVVVAFTPTNPFEGREVGVRFRCDAGAKSVTLAGVNTLRLTARAASRPDVLSIAATASNDGRVAIPLAGGVGAFSTAVLNNGPAQTLRVSVDQGRYLFPFALTVCETNASGACLAPPGAGPLQVAFAANQARTFAVFVDADDDLGTPFLPDIARAFLRVRDLFGTELSATSVAVSAPTPAIVPRTLNAQAAWTRAQADGARALLILREGETVFEQYTGFLSGVTYQQVLNSGTKSFSCAVVAAATDRGLLSVDDLGWSQIPQWTPPQVPVGDLALKSTIRLRDLMSISHGIPSGTAEADVSDNDIYRDVITTPSRYGPGVGALYGRMGFHGVAAMVEAATGQNVVTFLEETVLNPIGSRVSQWGFDQNGKVNLSAQAVTTARDWARFGQLMLNDGLWEGRQILSASSVRRCAHYRWPGFEGYGLSFWLNRPLRGSYDPTTEYVPSLLLANPDPQGPPLPAAPRDTYIAWGANNMQMFIIPSQRMVIVKFAGGGDQNAFFQALFGT